MPYLADTTLLIDYYRDDVKATEYFNKLESGEIRFGISVITEAEIWHGIKNDDELLQWVALLDIIESFQVTSKIARKAGEIYKKFGHYMGKVKENKFRNMNDAFIAATAIIKNRTLITGNYKHFKQLESRNLLKCIGYK